MFKRTLIAMLTGTCGVVTLAATACGGGNQQVEVKGKDIEMAKLVGDWEGDYQGTDSGRSGAVKFSLELGRHTAEGKVFMGGDTPLDVQFIQVDGGQLQGTIAPYVDPALGVEVKTSFLGTLEGDSISGMFTTEIKEKGLVQTGKWQVTRKPTE